MNRISNGTFSWQGMRPAVFKGVHQCLTALATAGNNVLFEHIIEAQEWLDQLVHLLAGLDVFFVGLHCSLAELERREAQRGNRRIGEARTDLQTVHSFAAYDLELNSEQPAEDNARRLIAAWKQRKRPSVFDQLVA
jgi:chloramphenicol 3-O phosphotransferase